jgi:hypothetical protein
MFTTLLSVVSAIAAVVALALSWKAVRIAEKTTSLSLFNELQKLYNSDANFRATQKVWEIYRSFPGYEKKSPISSEEAAKFVQEADRSGPEWKAVNDTSAYWRHVNFLVRKGYLEKEIAFEALAAPAILRFLYPIGKAWIEHNGNKYDYDGSLEELYELWQSYSNQRCNL